MEDNASGKAQQRLKKLRTEQVTQRDAITEAKRQARGSGAVKRKAAAKMLGTGATCVAASTRPYSLIYFVHDNVLAVLTYERQAGVMAWQEWAHAVSGAQIVSAAVVPESNADVLYIVVFYNSEYYLERQHIPDPTTQSDCVFLDGAYDVRQT